MSPYVARSREEGRAAVEQLVAAFSENLDYYKSPEFDETSARQRFIDPFFSALGWDVADQARRGPYADVILEFSLHDPAPTKGSAEADQTEEEAEDLRVATALAERTDTGPIGVRRPDYSFRINAELRFFVEAKLGGPPALGRVACRTGPRPPQVIESLALPKDREVLPCSDSPTSATSPGPWPGCR